MRKSLIVGAALLIAALTHSQSRVVIVKDTNAVRGSVIDTAVVRIMMDAGIKALTDSTTVGGAWKSCFPGLTASQNIAIKVNCLYTLSSHPEVTRAVTNGLTQMQVGPGTFRPWRAIIYDRTDSDLTNNGRYTIRTDTLGVRCVGNSHAGWGYTTRTYSVRGVAERFARALTDSAAFMINHSVLKDHSISGMNFTMNLKNHYGTVDAPGNIHGDGYHQVPEVSRILRDSLGNKQRVFLVNALYGVYNGGPGGSPQVVPRMLVLSKDIVACDYVGVGILDSIRLARGLGRVDSRTLAYAESIGLGSRNVQVIKIINPSLGVAREEGGGRSFDVALLAPQPNPTTGTTEIPFLMPRAGSVCLEVYNALGQRVKTLASGNYPSGRHTAVWDGKDEAGRKAPSGMYVIGLTVGEARIERTLGLVH